MCHTHDVEKMTSDLSPCCQSERVVTSKQNLGTIHGLSTLNYSLTRSPGLECNN